MLLSIFSSSNNHPRGYWLTIWLSIAIAILSLTLYFEISMRRLGWVPSVIDTKELWSLQRIRAKELGDKALIFIGASRVQLGIDLGEVQNNSDYMPVQLAIDGTSFMPVLEDLAKDKNITGTIIISISINNIMSDYDNEVSSYWVNYFNKHYYNLAPYKIIDNKISSFLDNSLAIRAEGASPVTNIYYHLFVNSGATHYLTMDRLRSRDADYNKVVFPRFYIRRLSRHLGKELTKEMLEQSTENIINGYKNSIESIASANEEVFSEGLDKMMGYIKTLEARGVNVILVRFPTDKMIWEIDQKKYPRDLFWNKLVRKHKKAIHFSDYPAFSKFDLPDGSHLDYRDKKMFTKELMSIVKKY